MAADSKECPCEGQKGHRDTEQSSEEEAETGGLHPQAEGRQRLGDRRGTDSPGLLEGTKPVHTPTSDFGQKKPVLRPPRVWHSATERDADGEQV